MIVKELGGFPEEVTFEWHLEGRIAVSYRKGDVFLVGMPGSR